MKACKKINVTDEPISVFNFFLTVYLCFDLGCVYWLLQYMTFLIFIIIYSLTCRKASNALYLEQGWRTTDPRVTL